MIDFDAKAREVLAETKHAKNPYQSEWQHEWHPISAFGSSCYEEGGDETIIKILTESGAVSIGELIDVYKQKNPQENYDNGFNAGRNVGLEEATKLLEIMSLDKYKGSEIVEAILNLKTTTGGRA
jgi:hypothetical protein